jgi:hypothetical protein
MGFEEEESGKLEQETAFPEEGEVGSDLGQWRGLRHSRCIWVGLKG